MLRAAPLAFAVILFGTSAVLAGEPLAPSEIQTTFFTGQAFTATTPSGTKFKMTFTPDGKMTREPLAQRGNKSTGLWKLNARGFCTTWGHSKSNCFTIVPSGENKRKRRIERLFIDEANWLREHPEAPELRAVSEFNQFFIQKGARCSVVWNMLALLPEHYWAAIRNKFKCPSTEYDDEWIDQIQKFIIDLHTAAALGALSSLEDPRSVGQIAAKIRELSAKQTALEDRLDMMIDKSLKRLATLKTFKQVVAIQETRQPRKISAS